MLKVRFVVAALIAFLPGFLKVPIYRHWFGYHIGSRVRIGLSIFVDVRHCEIGDGVRIGHFNVFLGTARLRIGRETRIGHLNLFRGGVSIVIGEFVSILRRNVLNSIPNAESVSTPDPSVELGDGSVITSNHWFDFTDRISIGSHAIIGGRGSSFWTHNRQRTRPIEIGAHAYMGSEVRFAPGASVAPLSIVALGAVVMDRFEEERVLIVGNPASVSRRLSPRDLFLVVRKTRDDLPQAIHHRHLSPDLVQTAREAEGTVMRGPCTPA